ncbi:UNVERIFIED_CONTAM: hypothetical protein RMT77_002281 [Armadillidium vulgare]
MEGENCDNCETESPVIQDKQISPKEREPCKFFLEGKCWFKDNCNNLHVGGEEKRPIESKESILNPASQKDEVQEINKKPSLRTAGDVRKRIQWDPMLNSKDFTIGYLDRFDGVVEKPFSAFTWEHLADAEIDDLAIPQHRIQYFKYKGKTVWDKHIRLDHVFGSAGNNKNIYDIIEEIDIDVEEPISNCSEESDSDAELDVNVSQEKSALSDAQEKVEHNKSLRATHFLCIKIDNEQLAKQVTEVQDHVISGDVMLRSCAMPSEILHVTLAMIKCDDDSAVESVSELLNELKDAIPELESFKSSKILKAKNLSTFGSRVLYSKLAVPPLFNEVITIIQKRLRKIKGVTITNHFDFVPHMTLIKVNRYIAKERRSKYIDSILYQKYFDIEFGDIIFNNIHFCIINDYRGVDGFYLTTKKIEF